MNFNKPNKLMKILINHSLINHPCQFEIQIETKQACPTYNVNSFFEKFIYNKYLLSKLDSQNGWLKNLKM